MRIINTHIVPEGTVPVRFSDYALKIFTVIPSRNGIKKAVKRGEFHIDGVRAETASWIRPGQRIDLLETGKADIPVYHLEYDVIFEDDFIAVLNKPAGITVSGNRFKTVENSLGFNLKAASAEDALNRPMPVHRLDSPTSGLLLIAKTRTAQISLGRQFETGSIRKRYRAVVQGRVEDEIRIVSEIDGREARTECVPVRSVRSVKNEWVTLVDLFPATGRTHQLRRHMAENTYPVVGDKQYGTAGNVFRGKGLFLAAVELSLVHPVSKNHVNIKIDEPEKFRTFMDREERRWNKIFAS